MKKYDEFYFLRNEDAINIIDCPHPKYKYKWINYPHHFKTNDNLYTGSEFTSHEAGTEPLLYMEEYQHILTSTEADTYECVGGFYITIPNLFKNFTLINSSIESMNAIIKHSREKVTFDTLFGMYDTYTDGAIEEIYPTASAVSGEEPEAKDETPENSEV